MNTQKVAMTVHELSISYKLYKKLSIKKSLLSRKNKKAEVFEAVKKVSFQLKQGQILGVVGKNGSGKSTMLKALAGIFSPDSGTIDLHDNSVSLMSIGVGFQTKLTGRENIVLSGMLLGFSEQEIRQKMDEIIAFSELGHFIDKPVDTYSSGMYSKLAFSITAILETDIILIDEVLSVGDEKFKKKSFKKMQDLISSKNHTVVIVSHSLNTLLDLCDQVLWIHDGEIRMLDEPKLVVDAYKEFMK